MLTHTNARRFARALALALGLAAFPAAAQVTTIADAANPPDNANVCPPTGTATPVQVDAFTVVGTAADAITRARIIVDPPGAYVNLDRISVTSNDTATVYGSAIPSGDAFYIDLTTPIPVTAAITTYKLTLTPKTQANMPPAANGKDVPVRATLNTVVVTNPKSVSNPNSATITIKNSAPADVVWNGLTSAATSVTLNWTGAGTNTVLVLRRLGGPVLDAPVDGVTPALGATLPNGAIVRLAANAATLADTGLVTQKPYYYKVFVRDVCGNWSLGNAAGPIYPGGTGEGDATPDSRKPVVGIVNPGTGGVTAPFRVQVRVFSPRNALNAVQPITSVTLVADNGVTTSSATLTQNVNYGNATDSGVWETAPAGFAPGAGTWTLRASAVNASGTVASGPVGVTVTTGKGDGNLLVRDNSEQLCADCHQVKTHSSESTGTKYGSWYVGCRGCHTPHGASNAGLIAKEITPPGVNGSQSPKAVFFSDMQAGFSATGGAANVPAAAHANADATGPCQVCHTRTTHYRNNGTLVDHNPTQRCTACHSHAQGLAASCTGCHGTGGRVGIAGADALVAAAPPLGTAGETATTATAVGAHQQHVNQATLSTNPIACSECHPSPNTHQGTVDIAFGPLARTGGSTPVWSGGPTCSSTWCHGAGVNGGTNKIPTWTSVGTGQAACGTCHGTPPPVSIAPTEDHPQNPTCANCHGAGYALAGITGTAKNTHIDGTVNSPNKGCLSCHGDLAAVADGTVVANTDARAAPGYSATAVDTQGNTATTFLGVGTHQAHVLPSASQGMMAAASCAQCHTLPANGDILHADGNPLPVFGAGAIARTGGVAATFTAGTRTCAVYCHSNAGPVGGGAIVTASPDWTNATNLTCTSCHAMGGAATTLSRAHQLHTNANYNYGCQRCHVGSTTNGTTIVAGGGAHVNGVKDVSFDAAAPQVNTAGAYASGTLTCSNTYCHSNGTKRTAPYVSGPSIAWTATGTCTSCHGTSAGANQMATGVHAQHVNVSASIGGAASTNFACNACHNSTVGANDTTIATFANHVNANPNVVFSATWGGTFVGGTEGAGTCSNVYCHSSGQATPAFKTISWNSAPVACNGCHGAETGAGTFLAKAGEPNYQSGAVGSATANTHQVHVGSSTDCATCHFGTVTAGGTQILATSVLHLDKTRQVAFDGTKVTGTPVYTAATKTCTVSCHGASSVQWGGPPQSCSSCHLSATDVNDFTLSNGIASQINTTEWSARGHGQTSAAYVEWTAAGITDKCLYCHDKAVSHNDGTNPFRLRGASATGGATAAYNSSATTVNAVCINCHGTGSFGVDPDGAGTQPLISGASIKVSAYHFGANHASAGTNGGSRCWDCHDPHGDGANVQQIGSDLMRNSADAHGFAGTRTAQAAVFTANTAWGNFVNTGATINGVCQVCHTATNHFLSTVVAAGDNTHNAGTVCTTCHLHAGQTGSTAFGPVGGACNACHNAPPTVGKHLAHDGVPNATFLSTAYGDTANHGTATAYGFGCGSCHAGTHQNSTGAGTSADPKIVEVTIAGVTYTRGANLLSAEASGVFAYSDGGGTATGCSASYCHDPQGAAFAGTAVTFNQVATPLACNACHDAPNATTANTLSGKHAKHINTNASTYAYGCQRCHSSVASGGTTITNKRLHADTVKQVAFDTLNPAGTYVSGTLTCNSVYCHSDGQPLGAASPTFAGIVWTATTSTDCTTCHGGNAAATGTKLTSNKHAAHVQNAAVIAVNYGCVDCHNTVVSGDRTISTPANHVNNSKQVGFANRGTAVSGAYASPSCGTNYCHSTGQDPAATNAARYKAIAWNEAAWPAGNAVCKKCHGADAGFTSQFGEPNYANQVGSLPNANSHQKHITAASDCVTCHNGLVNAGATGILGGSHTNGAREVAFLTTAAGVSAAYNSTSKTCSSVSCHGGTAVVWGSAALSCANCHSSAAADVNDFVYGNGTVSNVNSTEWTTRGHGQAAYTAFGAATDRCLYCHDGNVTHNTGTNPFRLRGPTAAGGASAVFNANLNNGVDVCLNCHNTTGSNGVDPDAAGAQPLATSTLKVSAYHYGAKHSTAADGGQRCWDCHDPHGDTNIKMIGSLVVKDSNDLYSYSATRVAGVTFTANTVGTDYAGATNRICNACHTTVAHYTSTTSDTHQAGAKCTACHSHSNGTTNAFTQATACNACHGDNSVTAPVTGEHALHVGGLAPATYGETTLKSTATTYAYACGRCHTTVASNHVNSTAAGTAASPYVVNVGFDWSSATTPYVAGGTVTNATWPASGLVYRSSNGTCTTYCHSSGNPVGGTQVYAAPTWAAATLTCTSCHGGGGAATTTLSPRHTKHVINNGTGVLRYSYACSRCHQQTISSGTSVLTNKANHVDNTRDVSFDTLNPSGTYATGTFTCSNVYCHSDGRPLGAATPTYVTALTWNAATTNAECSSCHGGNAAATGTKLTSNKHANHVQNAALLAVNYACIDCHNTVVSGDRSIASWTLHINSTKEVAFQARGTLTSGTYSSPTCASNYCHSTGQDPAATNAARYKAIAWNEAAWPAGNAICKKCHGADAGFTSQFGEPNYANAGIGAGSNSHQKHVLTAADCVTCHNGFVNAAATGIVGAKHTDGVRDVAFTGAGASAAYVSATKTCNNVSCHNNTPVQWGTTTISCSNCHLSAAADVNDFVYGNGTVSNINQTEWTNFGHGSVATTGNSFAEFSVAGVTDRCVYCHDTENSSANHNQAGNPFRLRGAANAAGSTLGTPYNTANVNAVCLNCHTAPASGGNGVDPDGAGPQPKVGPASGPDINAYHYGAKHSATADGGQRCWDCHDVHGDGSNIKMIGSDLLADSGDLHGYTGTRAPTAAVFTANTAGSNFAKTVAPFNGVCNVCHGQSATPANHYTRTAGDGHNNATVCTTCHSHQQAAAGAAFAPAGGDCIGCHTGTQTMAAGGTRRAIVGEFNNTWSHKRSAAGAVTKFDCGVCHMEGDAATGNTVAPYHAAGAGNGTVELRDPDTGTTITGATWGGTAAGVYTTNATAVAFTKFSRNLASGTIEPTTAAIMINLCSHCHDADGAANAAARVPGGTAGKPFNTTIAGAGYTAANKMTAATACPTTDGCVVNVVKDFATTNATYHPVLGKQNNSYVTATRLNAPYNSVTKTGGNNTQYGILITCFDCHSPLNSSGVQTVTVTAHGGSVTLRQGVWQQATAITATTVAAGNPGGNLCKVCHILSNTASSTHGTGSAWQSGGNSGPGALAVDRCYYCHSSSIAKPPRPLPAQDLHGFDTFAYPAQAANGTLWPANVAGTNTWKPYGFFRSVGSGGQWGTAGTNWKPLSGATVPTGSATCNANAAGVHQNTSLTLGTGCGGEVHGPYTPGGAY